LKFSPKNQNFVPKIDWKKNYQKLKFRPKTEFCKNSIFFDEILNFQLFTNVFFGWIFNHFYKRFLLFLFNFTIFSVMTFFTTFFAVLFFRNNYYFLQFPKNVQFLFRISENRHYIFCSGINFCKFFCRFFRIFFLIIFFCNFRRQNTL